MLKYTSATIYSVTLHLLVHTDTCRYICYTRVPITSLHTYYSIYSTVQWNLSQVVVSCSITATSSSHKFVSIQLIKQKHDCLIRSPLYNSMRTFSPNPVDGSFKPLHGRLTTFVGPKGGLYITHRSQCNYAIITVTLTSQLQLVQNSRYIQSVFRQLQWNLSIMDTMHCHYIDCIVTINNYYNVILILLDI